MKQRAFTIIEMVVSSTALALILGTTAAGVAMDTRVESVLTDGLGPEMTAQDALRRIRNELRTATLNGEDKNGNGQLDQNEDLNGDGALTSDWNLADQSIGEPVMVFNQRLDVRDENASVTQIGTVSPPIAYWADGSKLVRSTREENIVIARNVSNLRFARDGKVVTVTFEVGERTYSTRVWIRN